ncbi:GntR family transcriptional regulator [Devosia sp.]|uniref:GntR family transcriptional regulator n=1 Tax=Devosia sp. TaxID=1871048 RepID=UPI0032640167
MKSDTVFKLAFNEMLNIVALVGAGAVLPSENDLSAQLGVSRTTVRKVLTQLGDRGYVTGEGRSRIVVGVVPADAHFPYTETVPTSEQVERRFMEWMLRGDTKPGAQINELELAREFGVGTTGIREFLNRFRRFGLIEKRPNAGWLFKGFTEDFAMELFEIREMFELRSALALASLPPSSPVWTKLKVLERQHHDLLSAIDERFHDFSDLDNRFHRLINAAAPNRFIDDFYDIITFIFHYHYQWNKRDERQRNEVAIREHLAYIEALQSHDLALVRAVCSHHLSSAKTTMMQAFSPG